MIRVAIVSKSDKMTNAIRETLAAVESMDVQIICDVMQLRKQLLSRDYDLIFINYPLPSEKDYQLSFDIRAHSLASVIVFLPAVVYTQKALQMQRSGIVPVPKPVSLSQLKMVVEMSVSQFYHIHLINEKTQQLNARIVDLRYNYRAKCLLIEKKGMSEKEAHSYIEKMAMNHRITKREAALQIIAELENEVKK